MGTAVGATGVKLCIFEVAIKLKAAQYWMITMCDEGLVLDTGVGLNKHPLKKRPYWKHGSVIAATWALFLFVFNLH